MGVLPPSKSPHRPATARGLAAGHTLYLDDNAAGWSWCVDATPKSDSEFLRPGDQGEQNRIDLLTVVMHELGHLFGRDHDGDGLMAETLAAGVRPTELDDHVASLDEIVEQSSDHRADAWLGAWLSDQLSSTDLRAKRRW